MLARGLDSPYAEWVEKWVDKPEDADRVTTKVPCADYFELHEDRNLYVIKPEHINTDLEDVVEECDGFIVVRKTASS